jgi:hypothetical protein
MYLSSPPDRHAALSHGGLTFPSPHNLALVGDKCIQL